MDCPGLDLNISRESVQSSVLTDQIRGILYRKIRTALAGELSTNRGGYERFFQDFGKSLKLSAMEAEGKQRESLTKLLLFTDNTGKQTTLAEYVSRMQKDQNAVYYASGRSLAEIRKQPETERPEKMHTEYLCFTDTVDMLYAQMLEEYDGHPFISLADGKTEDYLRRQSSMSEEDTKGLLAFLKETFGDKVTDVVESARLETMPVLLSSGNGITFDMEKQLSGIRADRILEINTEHRALQILNKVRTYDRERAEKYAEILYTQACLTAGLEIDAAAYTTLLCSLWTE